MSVSMIEDASLSAAPASLQYDHLATSGDVLVLERRLMMNGLRRCCQGQVSLASAFVEYLSWTALLSLSNYSRVCLEAIKMF